MALLRSVALLMHSSSLSHMAQSSPATAKPAELDDIIGLSENVALPNAAGASSRFQTRKGQHIHEDGRALPDCAQAAALLAKMLG